MTMRLSSILMTAAAVLLAAGCKPAAETAENETLVKLRKAVDAGKNGTQTFHASSISDDDEEEL